MENGFDDPDAYGNMVAQAGDDMKALNGANLSGKVADYADEVERDAIVQIHTDTADAG